MWRFVPMKIHILFATIMMIAVMSLSSAGAQSGEPPILLLVEGDVWSYAPDRDVWQQHSHQDSFFINLRSAPDGREVILVGIESAFAEAQRTGQIVGDTVVPHELWLLSVPDGELRPLVLQDDDGPNLMFSRPDYGPDGRVIVWSEVVNSTGFRLAVYDRESTQITRNPLRFENNFSGYPEVPPVRYSPDETVAVIWLGVDVALEQRGRWLGMFDLQGQLVMPATLLEDEQRIYNVERVLDYAWLADSDGELVLLSSAFSALHVNPAAQTVERLQRPAAFGGQDTRLAFYSHGGESDIQWIKWMTGEIEALPFEYIRPELVALSPDGTAIAYVDGGTLTIVRDGQMTQTQQPDGLTPFRIQWGLPQWFIETPGLPYAIERLCPEGPISHIYSAPQGQVIAESGVPFYDAPNGEVIDTLEAGTVFDFYDGFNCLPGVNWWGAQLADGRTGWLRENEGDVYLLAPR